MPCSGSGDRARSWSRLRAENMLNMCWTCNMYPLVNYRNYGKSPFSMGKSTINGPLFNSYVKLPEGNMSFFIKSSGAADVSVPDETVFSRVRHLTNFSITYFWLHMFMMWVYHFQVFHLAIWNPYVYLTHGIIKPGTWTSTIYRWCSQLLTSMARSRIFQPRLMTRLVSRWRGPRDQLDWVELGRRSCHLGRPGAQENSGVRPVTFQNRRFQMVPGSHLTPRNT